MKGAGRDRSKPTRGSVCLILPIGKLTFPLSQSANWEIDLPVVPICKMGNWTPRWPFCTYVICRSGLSSSRSIGAIYGPGRIKERSKSAYLAFFLNCLGEHLQGLRAGSKWRLCSVGMLSRLDVPGRRKSRPGGRNVDFPWLCGDEEELFPIPRFPRLGKDRPQVPNPRLEELSFRIPRFAVSAPR
jgi:hypothetical protein